MTGYFIFWAVNFICLTVFLVYWGQLFDRRFRARATAIEIARGTDREQFEASRQRWDAENAKAQTDRESLLAQIRELISEETTNGGISEALSMPPNAMDAATEVTSPRSPLLFEVDFIEEMRLRRWARENYVSADERDVMWHPIVLVEMKRKDEEIKRAVNNAVQAG
jgi:hypothetical protein